MMKNENMKKLLKQNKKVFKALHELRDYDFAADFELLECEGSFTLNGIKKLLHVSDFDNLAVSIILPDARDNDLYIVQAYSDGFITEFQRRVYYRGIDHFWTKGQFEDVRKRKNKKFFVVAQDCNLLKPAKPDNGINDLSLRYKKIGVIGWGDGRGKHGISRIDILHPHTGKRYTYSTRQASASTDVNFFIDKSGYIVEPQRADLLNAAKRLKSDRKKAEVAAMDFMPELSEAKKRLQAVKAQYNSFFLGADTWEQLSKFDIALTRLKWATSSLERFQCYANEKRFKSVADAKSHLETLFADICKAEDALIK